MGVVLVILLRFNFIGVKELVIILIIGLALSLISTKHKIPFISYFLTKFDRKDSLPGKGALTYILGALIVVILFQKYPHIAQASILILAFGDSISLLVGKYHGKIKIPLTVKNIEGIIAGILAATFAASFFVSLIPAFIASTAAMIIEAYDFPLNDNITIPLVASTIIWLITIL